MLYVKIPTRLLDAPEAALDPEPEPEPTLPTDAGAWESRPAPIVGPALIYRACVKAVRTCLEIANREPAKIDELEYRMLSPLHNPTTPNEDAAAVKFISAYLRMPRRKQCDPHFTAIANAMCTTHTTMTAYLAVVNSIAKHSREARAAEDRQLARVEAGLKAAKLHHSTGYSYVPAPDSEQALQDLQAKVRSLEGQKGEAEQLLKLFDETFGLDDDFRLPQTHTYRKM